MKQAVLMIAGLGGALAALVTGIAGVHEASTFLLSLGALMALDSLGIVIAAACI